MIDLLTFTTLYPNTAQPRHGLFVAERLRHLMELDGVRSRVVAPVPWFPFHSARFGKYATFAKVPRSEKWDRLEVLHPRYPVIPKVGMSLAPALMFRAVRSAVRRVLESGYEFDAIESFLERVELVLK